MQTIFGNYANLLYGVLRIVAGLLFAQHGAQKLFGVLGGMGGNGVSAPFFSLMWVAGIVECVGGLLIAVGSFAPIAAFVAAGQMAVAYFMVHVPQGFWPILNRGELAALYCFLFLVVASRGSGPLSLDALRRRK